MLYTKVAVLVDRCFFLFIYFLRFLFSGRKIHFKDVCSCVRSTTIPCAYRNSGVRAAKKWMCNQINKIDLTFFLAYVVCWMEANANEVGKHSACLAGPGWISRRMKDIEFHLMYESANLYTWDRSDTTSRILRTWRKSHQHSCSSSLSCSMSENHKRL